LPAPLLRTSPLLFPGAAAFKEFQDQMRFLLRKIQKDGEPAADNFDIGAQVGCGRVGLP
jgi:hypothetical protein